MIYLMLTLWLHLLVAFAIGAITGYFLQGERTGGTS